MAGTSTLKTRIQLKSDTEANWDKAGPKNGSNGFIPLSGELIIYSADNAHPFSRLKVGDGVTNVTALPFIDAGTINGEVIPENEIVQAATFSAFPIPGQAGKLYIDLSTSRIYCYSNSSGYTQLSNFEWKAHTTEIPKITSWAAGILPQGTIENNTLKITNGLLPELNYYPVSVVTSITKEVST